MQMLARFISSLISLYTFVIVLRIFLSWGGVGATRFGTFYSLITRITDPYLGIFRRLPGLQRGMLDFSPVVAMIVLGIFNNIFALIAEQGRLTFGIIMAVAVQAIGSVLSFFIVLFIILLGIRLMLEYRRTPNSIQYIAVLDNLLSGAMNRVHSLFLRGRETAIRPLLYWSIGSFVALHIVFRALIRWLAAYLVQLPF